MVVTCQCCVREQAGPPGRYQRLSRDRSLNLDIVMTKRKRAGKDLDKDNALLPQVNIWN